MLKPTFDSASSIVSLKGKNMELADAAIRGLGWGDES